MHGTITAFKPNHRLEAASELAAHITHDELNPTPTATNDNTPDVGADPRVRPLSTEADSTVVPAPNPVVPAKAGTHPVPTEPTKPARLEPVEAPHPETNNQKPTTKNFPPITIDDIMNVGYLPHHITNYKFARDQITGAVYAFDETGPFEVDEDGDIHYVSPDLIEGYGNAPFQTFEESDLPDKPARNLTIAERRIRQKLKDHWHEPDPLAGTPFFSSRSPPW